jgi:hypothetical protein
MRTDNVRRRSFADVEKRNDALFQIRNRMNDCPFQLIGLESLDGKTRVRRLSAEEMGAIRRSSDFSE